MRLDVIIPTYNRADLLARALDSLIAASRPPDLDVLITVVDNNASDDTHARVARYEAAHPGLVRYLFEGKQGRSAALNAGIRATDGELVGMVDDDEEVAPDWFDIVHQWLSRDDVDFISGPYLPHWEVDPPAWVHGNAAGPLGIPGPVDRVTPFTPDFPGTLMGGNAVVRRALLERAGPYDEAIGRRGRRLLSSEDADMQVRLLAAGGRGYFNPHLQIRHFIPASRLSRRYFRRWHFWEGVSQALIARSRREPVPHVAGVPRYRIGAAVRAWPAWLRATLRGNAAEAFGEELRNWHLAGYVYGRFFYQSEE